MIEGRILERRDSYVTATMTNRNGKQFYAEIDLDRFADSDRPDCQPGTLFIVDHPRPDLKLRRPGRPVRPVRRDG